MYIISGATGHTGSIIAKKLLSQGKKVRVLGRSADRLNSVVSLGAEPFTLDVTDKNSTIRAFNGGQAAYLMIPPDLANPDVTSYQEKVTEALATAVQKNAIKHVVLLSSIGADKQEKTGPIVGLHRFEERLKSIHGLNVLSVRAGYFMENTLTQTGIISQMGVVAGPLNPELKLPLIATRDIGGFAADALLALNFQGHQTQELLGERDVTYTEAAAIIGAAIGKPDLRYQQIALEQFHGALRQMGMSQSMADLVAEMSDSINSGHVRALESRSPRNTTPISYEQFVADTFLPAYRASAAAA